MSSRDSLLTQEEKDLVRKVLDIFVPAFADSFCGNGLPEGSQFCLNRREIKLRIRYTDEVKLGKVEQVIIIDSPNRVVITDVLAMLGRYGGIRTPVWLARAEQRLWLPRKRSKIVVYWGTH